MAEAEFSSAAYEWIQDAPADLQQRIGSKLRQAQDNPEHFLTSLRGGSGYKLRIGDYRAEIQWVRNDDSEDVLFVRRLGHRDGFWD